MYFFNDCQLVSVMLVIFGAMSAVYANSEQAVYKALNEYVKNTQKNQELTVEASNDDYVKQDSYKHEEKEYPHQPYGFGYNIEDGYGNKQWRHEKSGNPHQVSGTYGFKDKNGVYREVEYIADKNGFRAVIKTTEPGTNSNNPAYVKLQADPIHVDYHPTHKETGKHQANYQQAKGTQYAASNVEVYPNKKEETVLYGKIASNDGYDNGDYQVTSNESEQATYKD